MRNSTGIPLRESQPTPGTSHPGCGKIQNEEQEINSRMEINIGGKRVAALAKANSSTKIHKIMGGGPVPH